MNPAIPIIFDVAQSYIDAADYDRAATCLDPIVSILISRRETDRAIHLYEEILQRQPSHIVTMVKLASMFFAIDDHDRYLNTLSAIIDYYLNQKSPIEALEYIEKALQLDPENEKYQALHQRTFAEAYPNEPYTPPATVKQEQRSVSASSDAIGKGEKQSSLVEIDLLLNYGMKEKALYLLQSLEASRSVR